MKKALILMLLAAFALCGCTRYRHMVSFTGKDGVRLEVEGRQIFSYDAATCQMSWSQRDLTFRAGTDNMSDWFCARFDARPSFEGQNLKGDLRWSTSTGVQYRKGIALQIIKLEGDMVWLWTSSSNYALVVRILE